MEHRNLEITLVSADDLKDINLVGKMDVYAVAYLVGDPKTKQKTGVDKNCGTTPKWNHKMKFTINEHSLASPHGGGAGLILFVQLMAEKFGPDKDIGGVSLNILELFENWKATKKEGDNNGGEKEKMSEYKIQGKGKGTLKISYKFGEKFTQEEKSRNVYEPALAYPVPGYGQAGPSMPPQQGAYPPYQGYGVGGPPPPQPQPHMAYPPNQGYGMGGPPPPQPGYYPNQQPHGYGGYGAPPPQGYGGYGAPPPQGYGGYYPPPQGGYAPPQPYGYNPHAPQKKKKNSKMGLGMGLGAGLLGGMLIGDMVGDMGDAAAYADGYGDAMGDVGGDFDF